LFPIIGALKNGQLNYQGKFFELPKHGLVRNSVKPKLIESGTDFLRFGMAWDAETLEIYPFKFSLEITFLLDGKSLQIQHRITNSADESMLYSIGGHPAFNCPLKADESYEDYYLEFEEEETAATWLIDQSGLISLEQKPILDHTKNLPLHSHLFDYDALVFKNLKSSSVKLFHRKKGPLLAVDFEDFNYLGIWAKPAAPFVCIEPWLGIADSVDSSQNFEEKEGVLKLASGQSDQKIYSISILE
jgi:galactose mutarotase-like enzyme